MHRTQRSVLGAQCHAFGLRPQRDDHVADVERGILFDEWAGVG